MKRWKYCTLSVDLSDYKGKADLNRKGAEGWEAFAMEPLEYPNSNIMQNVKKTVYHMKMEMDPSDPTPDDDY